MGTSYSKGLGCLDRLQAVGSDWRVGGQKLAKRNKTKERCTMVT